jgi:hypothetical protein
MEKICVEIEIGEDGLFSVGICPPEDEASEKDYLEGVGSIDAALAKAKELLQGKSPSPQEAVISEMGLENE